MHATKHTLSQMALGIYMRLYQTSDEGSVSQSIIVYFLFLSFKKKKKPKEEN